MVSKAEVQARGSSTLEAEPKRTASSAASGTQRALEQRFRPGAVIQTQEAQEARLLVLLSGWAVCSRTSRDGRRQILRILIAGDICGLPQGSGQSADCATVALTNVWVADYGSMAQVMACRTREEKRLVSVVARARRENAAAVLDHIVRLGRMSPLERMADLLLELYARLHRVGLTQGQAMPFPLTQDVLADYLGMSLVHVNRTLQQLRRKELITYGCGRASLLAPEALAALCGRDLEIPTRLRRLQVVGRGPT